jgi:hypothetical protein
MPNTTILISYIVVVVVVQRHLSKPSLLDLAWGTTYAFGIDTSNSFFLSSIVFFPDPNVYFIFKDNSYIFF